jgi:hypothetical protein
LRQAELIRYLILAAQREGNRRLVRELRVSRITGSNRRSLESWTITGSCP